MRNFFLIFLISFALIAADSFTGLSASTKAFAQQTNQSDVKIDKIKKDVQKVGIGQDLTVSLKNGREYYGYIKDIGSDSFQVSEIDIKAVVDVNFSDVKKVKKGFNSSLNNQGKRKSPYTGLIVGAAIFGTLFTILAIALSDKDF